MDIVRKRYLRNRNDIILPNLLSDHPWKLETCEIYWDRQDLTCCKTEEQMAVNSGN